MITKLHSPHPNLTGTLRYNFRKVEKREAVVLYTRGLGFTESEEVKFLNTKDRMYDFLPEKYRTVNITFHASINPHEEDNMSDAMMELFIDEYMEELGYGKQPYVVFKHEDIDRTHFHVVSLNVDKDGDKIDDRFIKKRSWEILKRLSAKYGIKPPSYHLKKEREKKLHEPPTPIIYKEGNLSAKIKGAVDYAMEVYKPKSIGELSAILIGYNIFIETIKKGQHDNSNTDGEGLLYYITDEDGKRMSIGIKASDLGFHYLRKQLEAKFKENKRAWKAQQANRIRYAVAWALRNAQDPITLSENLKQAGIFAHMRFSDDGRLYGVTYIDSYWGTVCNGADVGKEFSAHTLNEYFNDKIPHQWVVNNDRSDSIKKSISETLKENLSLDEFVERLREKGIHTMVQRDERDQLMTLVFADEKRHVVTNSNEMGDHYSTILFRHYFDEEGTNFWVDDEYNTKPDRTLWAEEQSFEKPQYYSNDDIIDEIIDSMGDSYSSHQAESVGRMYQRQAERNWGRGRRRR